jgi:hypothetical protein
MPCPTLLVLPTPLFQEHLLQQLELAKLTPQTQPHCSWSAEAASIAAEMQGFIKVQYHAYGYMLSSMFHFILLSACVQGSKYYLGRRTSCREVSSFPSNKIPFLLALT